MKNYPILNHYVGTNSMKNTTVQGIEIYDINELPYCLKSEEIYK